MKNLHFSHLFQSGLQVTQSATRGSWLLMITFQSIDKGKKRHSSGLRSLSQDADVTKNQKPSLSQLKGFPGGSEVKASARNAEDPGSIPGSGRSPGVGNGNSCQCSCLENPMDRGAQWATVHVVSESDMTEHATALEQKTSRPCALDLVASLHIQNVPHLLFLLSVLSRDTQQISLLLLALNARNLQARTCVPSRCFRRLPLYNHI